MSTLHPSPEEAATPPTRWRRGRRSSMAGTAVVARGEPMVWLTGGALALALVMIVGLLALLVVQGARTFWPQPIVRMELRDGRVLMGEVTEAEQYALTAGSLSKMPEPIAAAAAEVLGGRPQAEALRRHLRIGNFELTGQHYDWISDFALKPEGLSHPEWAVLIERTEWGRFYGEPKAFVVRHVRPVSGDEDQLQRILTFFAENQFRLAEDRQAAVQQALERQVGNELQNVRQKALNLQIERLEKSAESQRTAVLESDEAVPLAQRPPGQNVLEIREVWSGPANAWSQFERHHDQVRRRFERRRQLEEHDLGELNRQLEAARLAVREQELQTGLSLLAKAQELAFQEDALAGLERAAAAQDQLIRQIERRYGNDSELAAAARSIGEELTREQSEQRAAPHEAIRALRDEVSQAPVAARRAVDALVETHQSVNAETEKIVDEIRLLNDENARYALQLTTADGQDKTLEVGEIVRAFPANQLDLGDKTAVYFSRWWEFLSDDPREANSEGGVFPAIWGTVTMTLIMSLAVVPFGVLAALYLREYARAGFIVSAVRIAVNNLAGVPSIVFGVFGLGFFCYIFGAYVDGGPKNAGITPWPAPIWFAVLGGLAVAAVGAFFTGLLSLARRHSAVPTWKKVLGRVSLVLWVVATALLVTIIAKTPFFDGFYSAGLPNPTFGKGGLIWAALTLALMTLPVVIVATEEALAAVPNSMREGSYACGASKWQTIWRIVLPRAMPGIMTGMILAMARGAGEVAPLMLVGAVKLAPELPLDTIFPFLHADRSFMHLGFHIYDLGFQSQNSEAAKPMVFTTTLLLIAIIAALNLVAIGLRARLRRRFQAAQF